MGRAGVPSRSLRAQAGYLSALPGTGYYSDSSLAEDEADVALARARAGDKEASSSYVAWLMTGTPRGLASERAFEPLWRFPRDPAAAAASARLFALPAPAWAPDADDKNSPALGDLLESPLLGMTAFRRSFLGALRDKTVIGNLKMEHGWQSGAVAGLRDYTPDDGVLDPLRPKAPWTLAVRRCDLYAWHLSQLGGMPRFQLYWPQPRRDAAIAQAADRMRRYGARFEYQPGLEALWGQGTGYAHSRALSYLWSTFNAPRALLAFPPLSRPATPAEAARGEAIFSLAGQGTRVCGRSPGGRWRRAGRPTGATLWRVRSSTGRLPPITSRRGWSGRQKKCSGAGSGTASTASSAGTTSCASPPSRSSSRPTVPTIGSRFCRPSTARRPCPETSAVCRRAGPCRSP